jgi:hypothetical protein
MEGDEGRVEERRGEDDQYILKISTFHYLPLSSPSIPNIPRNSKAL